MAGTIPQLHVADHMFLSAKDAEPGGVLPSRWVKLHLAGCGDGDGDGVTLALSDAFADGAGRWHAFPGYEMLFPGATTLPFNGSYDDLIGGIQNLHTLPLGRASALQAIATLARCDDSCATPEPDVKAALARLKVVTTEALRWRPIHEAFSGELCERETFVAEEHARYVEHWAELSHLLWLWDATGRWGGHQAKEAEKIDVHNATQALGIVDLLKRPRELCIPHIE